MLSRSSLLILILCLLSLPLTTQAQSAWFFGYSASTTSSTATLSWVTAVPATTQLHYGLTTSYGTHTALDTTLTTTHSTTLTGLASGSTYHLRFTARDAAALQITSLDYTFTTQTVAVTISISPTTGTVMSGGTQQFTAQVNNASNKAVTWKASIGSVTTGGLFTAPIITTDQAATITATSVADTTKSASAVLTVKAPVQHVVSLNWQSSPSNDVVAYNVYRSSTKGGPYGLVASAVQGLTYSDATVQSGTVYYYVTTASDDTGQESAPSNEVTAAVPSP